MGSFDALNEAKKVLSNINDDFVTRQIVPKVEKELNRFWPNFLKKFEFDIVISIIV